MSKIVEQIENFGFFGAMLLGAIDLVEFINIAHLITQLGGF